MSPKSKLLSSVTGQGAVFKGWHGDAHLRPASRAQYRGSSTVSSSAEDATALQHTCPPGLAGPKTSSKCLISNAPPEPANTTGVALVAKL